ncbi:auxin response factor 9-like [Hibiscus syriacus]|uniref:Auxin response factor 9-like n=1 Tax=Hibiscus syriacus TaxID=106335 RepID=A0A6A3CJK5_HIBSY|nr:auxin response factor 9-like [Hibiscus syriacus]
MGSEGGVELHAEATAVISFTCAIAVAREVRDANPTILRLGSLGPIWLGRGAGEAQAVLLLDAKVTKLSSPTTVLEGPYMGRARFQSSSFRMGGERYGSFRSVASDSPEMVQLGTMVLSKRGYTDKGFLGSWRRRPLRLDIEREDYAFASSGEYGDKSVLNHSPFT